jgi:hypothetical protein
MELIIQRVVGSTNTTTPVFLESFQVDPGEFGIYDFGALYNESGEAVTLQWVIRRGSTVIFVSADLTVADGDAYATTDLPTLMEAEILAARVTGTAAKGKITMVLSGVEPSPLNIQVKR